MRDRAQRVAQQFAGLPEAAGVLAGEVEADERTGRFGRKPLATGCDQETPGLAFADEVVDVHAVWETDPGSARRQAQHRRPGWRTTPATRVAPPPGRPHQRRLGPCGAGQRCADEPLWEQVLARVPAVQRDRVRHRRAHGRGIGLRILTGRLAGTYTPTGEGKFFFTMMAAFGELERDMLRTFAGLAAAREQGRVAGVPPS